MAYTWRVCVHGEGTEPCPLCEKEGVAPKNTELTSQTETDIEQLRKDNRLLALAAMRAAPYTNTQTDQEVSETTRAFYAAVKRALPEVSATAWEIWHLTFPFVPTDRNNMNMPTNKLSPVEVERLYLQSPYKDEN